MPNKMFLKQLIPATLEIPIKQPIQGETIVYGEILRLGGKEPKIMLASSQGPTLYCDASRALVLSLGNKIYQTVGLRGIAEWNPDSLEIEQFTALELTAYDHKSVAEAFLAVSDEVGKDLPDIDIAKIRGDS